MLADAIGPITEVVEASKNKLQRRNDELAAELKSKNETIESFKTKIEKFGLEGDGGGVEQKLEARDDALKFLRESMASMEQNLEAERKARLATESKLRRKELDDLVLGDVAPDLRETARATMEGTLHLQNVKIDETEDLGTLAEMLRAKIKPILAIPTPESGAGTPSQRPAEAVKDPTSVDWNSYTSLDDVPASLHRHIPIEQVERMLQSKQDNKRGVGGIGI